MNRDQRFYSLEVSGTQAELLIFGDIVPYSDGWFSDESDVTAYGLVQELNALEGVELITVRIKSFGGDVNEGLAIYNALRSNDAKIVTRVDGFACSIASVIAMAGVERVMCESSLLMVHNPWTSAWGANAAEMRKMADDLDKIAAASKMAYLSRINISPDELDALMDAETWITPEEALEMGFATSIETFEESSAAPSQCARKSLFELVKSARRANEANERGGAHVKEESGDADGDDPIEETEPIEDPDPIEEPDDVEDPHDPDDSGSVQEKSQEATASVFMALEKVLNERSTNEGQ